MVEFLQLPKTIVSGIAETLTQAADAFDAIIPPTPVVMQNSDTQYIAATVRNPERKPRPVSSLDGAERIQNAFGDVPQVPGHIDFAYDPIARIHGHNVMALRLKGQTVVTTIQNWPTEGKFAETMQDATMAANGYSIMSLSEKDLGPMEMRALPALTAVGTGTALMIEFPQVNIQLSLETAVEIAKKSRSAGLAKFFVDSFVEFTAMAPVPGAGASAAAQAKMLERLPFQMRHAVIREMNSIGSYAGSRSGFVGLGYVQKMGPGFEQRAEPVQRPVPVKQAGWGFLHFIGWVLGALGVRYRPQNKSVAALPNDQQSGQGRYARGPEATEVIPVGDVPVSPSLMLVDAVHFHRPNGAMVRLAGAAQVVKFDILRTSGGNAVDGEQIRFDNTTVSRHHARVSYDPSKHELAVADLGSTNGTRVTVGRQAPVTLPGGVHVVEVRTETMAVIKCGDTLTTVYLNNGQGPVVVPAHSVPPRQVPVAAKPAPQPSAQSVSPQEALRQRVTVVAGELPPGTRGNYLSQRSGEFAASFNDAAGNAVRIQGPETVSEWALAAIARRFGSHLGRTQTRLPVSLIVQLVSREDFNTQKEFRGINGQTRHRVEDGGIVTIGQSGGNTMTSMNFGANDWGVATLLHPDTVAGRSTPTGVVMTVYMLVPEDMTAAHGKMGNVITALQNTLRPQLGPNHPLMADFLDGLK
jgi:hypothetical protein